jgi:pectate lyase
MLNTHKSGLAAALVASFALYACGGGSSGGSDSSTTTTTTTTTSSAASSSSVTSSTASSSAASSTSAASGSVSNTAIGWASYYASSSSSLTGGTGASTAKTYTVTTRKELLDALYNSTETVAKDGTYSGGTLDSSAKIVYVKGTISLNTNLAGTELTADDYVLGSCAYSTEKYSTAAALYTAYEAAYNPTTWVPSSHTYAPDDTKSGEVVTGKPAYARTCAANYQKQVVVLYVPSNTSIIGVGSDAKIVHGNLSMGTSSAAVDNIIVRNITFEDAFDFFPAWDSTDSTTGRWNTSYDLISVLYATHVWIDHNEFSDGTRTDDLYPSVWNSSNTTNLTASDSTDYSSNEVYKFMHHDGMVDVTKSASLVTLSYNYFHDHDKSFLIGGTNTANASAEHPGVLNVTFHHNYFKNLKQRQPRVRYGMVHVFDNYYENSLASTGVYGWAVGWTVGQAGKIYAENNAFALASGSTVANIYSVNASSSTVTTCAALKDSTTSTLLYSTSDCSAYFYDAGTYLNGTLVDVTSAITAASSLVSSTLYWKPSTYYSYSLDSASTLSSTIPSSVGVGKL